MRKRHTPFGGERPALPIILLAAFFFVLWLAGGASREDVSGQLVVRFSAWAILMFAILGPIRPSLSGCRTVAFFLVAVAALPLLQLIPVPSAIWHTLPGDGFVRAAGRLSADEPAWRPLSMVPGATLNALFSLVVPFATLVLAMSLGEQRRWLPGLLLCFIAASAMVGLMQFSGLRLSNPFINDAVWYIGGTFANRNHFALLLAIGSMLAPVWAFRDDRPPSWQAPAALGIMMLFSLIILATGSRTGMVVGALAIALGLAIVRRNVERVLGNAPRWMFPALAGGVVVVILIAVILSVLTNRAISIERVFTMAIADDLRLRAMPTVIDVLTRYFPFGTGFGSFDPMFRISEPDALLQRTYFNHAHNDVIETVMEGGLAAAVLLGTAVGWWGMKSWRAWRTGNAGAFARLGSATLLLVFIASLSDYPARTPAIMAVVIVAGLWLGGFHGDQTMAGRQRSSRRDTGS